MSAELCSRCEALAADRDRLLVICEVFMRLATPEQMEEARLLIELQLAG